MNLLYEEVYKLKQKKYITDGDLHAFNQFISSAQEYQFAVVKKEMPENTYTEWLINQKEC